MSKMIHKKLPTGQDFFTLKRGYGMCFYPTLPETTKWPEGYIPDFIVNHPDDYPTWMQNLQTEHATVELRDDYIIWWGGTVCDGIWRGDEKTIWMGGQFREGIVLGGNFYNCNWVHGEKRGGNFYSGIWRGGCHRGGLFGGLWLSGVWLGGEFNGYREKTTEPPSLHTEMKGYW